MVVRLLPVTPIGRFKRNVAPVPALMIVPVVAPNVSFWTSLFDTWANESTEVLAVALPVKVVVKGAANWPDRPLPNTTLNGPPFGPMTATLPFKIGIVFRLASKSFALGDPCTPGVVTTDTLS